jgi:hypothetical protein
VERNEIRKRDGSLVENDEGKGAPGECGYRRKE